MQRAADGIYIIYTLYNYTADSNRRLVSTGNPKLTTCNLAVYNVRAHNVLNSVLDIVCSNNTTIYTKAPFVWRKVVPGKSVTLRAESTLASVYMRKKLTPLPESTVLAHALIALTELTRLGEPKFLNGEKLLRLGG